MNIHLRKFRYIIYTTEGYTIAPNEDVTQTSMFGVSEPLSDESLSFLL